jgi:translation initiation factor 1
VEALMARGNDKGRIPLGSTTPAPTSSPFAALAGLREQLPAATTTAMTATAAAETAKKAPARFSEKVVVRLERKGHGGKTVTVVSGVLASARDEVMGELKKKLGTGARDDGDDIVVQGDVVDRVIAWLQGAGAKKVVKGSG